MKQVKQFMKISSVDIIFPFMWSFMWEETRVSEKITCLTYWQHDHCTCGRWVSNLGCSNHERYISHLV